MKEKIALTSVIVNSVLTVGKIVVGFLSNSTAVLAEGVHSLMDIFASGISYVGIKLGQKPADDKHPYGHYKHEVLAGVVITLILAITGFSVLLEAFKGLANPEAVKVSYLVLGVMLLSTVVNEIMARWKIRYGKEENSIALLSDGAHSRVDVFVSLAVFLSLIISRYWPLFDALIAFIIGLYIIKESFTLGKEAIDSLLDTAADPEVEERIKEIVQAEKIEIGLLKTQQKGAIITVSLEIKLDPNLKVEAATKIANDLRTKLLAEIDTLKYITIQIVSHDLEDHFFKPRFGKDFGWQRHARYKGHVEGAKGLGPAGNCICAKCGYQVAHEAGTPCTTLECPKCKIKLQRA